MNVVLPRWVQIVSGVLLFASAALALAGSIALLRMQERQGWLRVSISLLLLAGSGWGLVKAAALVKGPSRPDSRLVSPLVFRLFAVPFASLPVYLLLTGRITSWSIALRALLSMAIAVNFFRAANAKPAADGSLSPDFVEAFPEEMASHVRAVAAMMRAPAYTRSPDDIGPITLNGRPLRIPARIYHPELDPTALESLAEVEQSIAACLYTRHHDGYVRQRALARAITIDEPWAAPFVLQLLGEYVIELVDMVAAVIKGPQKNAFVVFLRENPAFLELTTQRAVSYWNQYHRKQFPNRKDYPALSAITTLRVWLSS